MKKLLMALMFLCLATPVLGVDLDTDFVHAWKFNNEATLVDYVGTADSQGIGITAKDAVGMTGTAWDFEATNTDWVQLGDNAFGTRARANYTLSVWIKIETVGTGGIFQNRGDAELNDAFGISTNSAMRFRADVGGAKSVSANGVLTAAVWENYVFRKNSTHMSIFVNGTHSASISAVGLNDIVAADNTTLGAVWNALTTVNYDGLMDEFYVWHRALNDTEITQLYNSSLGKFCTGDPCSFITSSTIVISSFIDLLFRNSTGSYTSSMGEGEDFSTFINWTWTNGTLFNASYLSSGVCNITLEDALSEYPASNTNFTTCSTGCDFTTYSEVLSSMENNSDMDYLYFNACHLQIPTGGITANITCSDGSYQEVISSDEFPLCSLGYGMVSINSSVCTNSTSVTIKVGSPSLTNNKRKNINSLAFDREFALHVQNATYNITSSLWELEHEHEYHDHGTKTIIANCSFPSNSTFDNSTSESITIVNSPPVIFIESVNTSLGLTSLTNGVSVEYASGIWNWFLAIIDDDSQWFNVSWGNSSGYIMHSIAGNTSMISLQTPDGLFADFDGNPFSINVTVNDSFGAVTNASLYFNVNDTTNPACDFANDSVLWNEVYYFDNTCTDESFFSLNVTCDNNFNFSVTGLNVTSYNFENQTQMEQDNVTCTARWCDGHTGELSLEWDVVVKDNKFTFNQKNTLEINTDAVLSYEKLYDRVKFSFEMPKDLPANLLTEYKYTYTFTYTTTGKGFYFKSEKYQAWIVDSGSETWFDLNGVEGDVTVKQLSDYTFEIKVMTDQTSLAFESIGELNCAERIFVIEAMAGMMSCQYDSSPYIKSNIGINDRHLIPLLCQITGGTNQTYKCTTKVKNEGYLLQTNPEPLIFDQDLFRVVEKRNYGFFTAKQEGAATQNVLAYFTNMGLRDGLNATVFVDCVADDTLLTWNATITPAYKDMKESTIDVMDKAQDNVKWVFLSIFTLLIVIALLLAVFAFVKERFR
jgi:hypothetical protein